MTAVGAKQAMRCKLNSPVWRAPPDKPRLVTARQAVQLQTQVNVVDGDLGKHARQAVWDQVARGPCTHGPCIQTQRLQHQRLQACACLKGSVGEHKKSNVEHDPSQVLVYWSRYLTLRGGTSPSSSSRKMMDGEAAAAWPHMHTTGKAETQSDSSAEAKQHHRGITLLLHVLAVH